LSHQPKKTLLDPATILALRRSEISAEYRFHGLDPIRIGTEPISMELALQLGLLIDTAAQQPADAYQEAGE
jgi:hypothetical protein